MEGATVAGADTSCMYVQLCCLQVGVSASKHLSGTPGAKDFSEVIARAQQLPGFSHEPEAKEVTVGFGHQATLGAGEASGFVWPRVWFAVASAMSHAIASATSLRPRR